MMEMAGELKPIGPFLVGQIVDYVDLKPERKSCPSGNWYAVITEPKQESMAMHEIADRGFVTYLPIVPREEPHGRGAKRFAERPMFSSLLFASCLGMDEYWGRITNARGVRKLLGMNGRPSVVSDAEMDVIRLFEAEKVEEEAQRLGRRIGQKSRLIWHFSPEEKVRIIKGPFAGFCAELQTAVDSHDRLRALVNLFGRKSSVQLSAFDIEKL